MSPEKTRQEVIQLKSPVSLKVGTNVEFGARQENPCSPSILPNGEYHDNGREVGQNILFSSS